MNKSSLKSHFWRYYLPVFLIFSITVLAFQYNREKHYKADLLDTKLGDSNNIIFNFLENSNGSLEKFDSLIMLSPYKDIRITVIDLNGKVVYDNVIKKVESMDNHLTRKEIIDAQKNNTGSDIRTSITNNQAYYYHANRFGNCYIRSSVHYDMNILSVLSPNNLFLYFWLVLTFLIITALFYMSNRLTIKMQREQIEHDANVRRQLTQQVAHELKTPLSSIIGYMETLHNNSDISEERKQFFIDRSHTQAIRLNELLQDILVLNQLNEAPRTVQKEPLHLNKIIDNVLEDVAIKLQENDIKVNVSLGGDIWIKANSLLIYSIFRNLIDNVLSYAGTNTEVNITLLREDSKFYYFNFSDTGTGVNKECLPFLFDRFYRVDKGRSRKTGGTGLGLSIVKNAVEFHEGVIGVNNREGGGLQFNFSIHK
jgi:signal transduction histidine kinase